MDENTQTLSKRINLSELGDNNLNIKKSPQLGGWLKPLFQFITMVAAVFGLVSMYVDKKIHQAISTDVEPQIVKAIEAHNQLMQQQFTGMENRINNFQTQKTAVVAPAPVAAVVPPVTAQQTVKAPAKMAKPAKTNKRLPAAKKSKSKKH